MLNGVQGRVIRDRDQIAMTKPPECTLALIKGKPEANRGTGEARDDGAAPLIGKVNHQVIMLSSQCAKQLPLFLEMLQRAQLLPFAIDTINCADRRMRGEHIASLFIKKHVDLRLRPFLA